MYWQFEKYRWLVVKNVYERISETALIKAMVN